MPARVFLDSHDLSVVLGICRSEAQYMLNAFELRGKIVAHGRKKTVDVRVLTQHLCEQDGADPVQRRKDILEVVREIDREKRESEGGDDLGYQRDRKAV